MERYILYGWTHSTVNNYMEPIDDPEDFETISENCAAFYEDLENDEKKLIDIAIEINKSDDLDAMEKQRQAMLNDDNVIAEVNTIQIWDSEEEFWIIKTND